MFFAQNDADTLFLYAKLPMIALALLLGYFVYLWSRELFGAEVAVASALFYALDPNFLAHSSVVQTDVPFAVFFYRQLFFLAHSKRFKSENPPFGRSLLRFSRNHETLLSGHSSHLQLARADVDFVFARTHEPPKLQSLLDGLSYPTLRFSGAALPCFLSRTASW